jgi:hypothetical protein
MKTEAKSDSKASDRNEALDREQDEETPLGNNRGSMIIA